MTHSSVMNKMMLRKKSSPSKKEKSDNNTLCSNEKFVLRLHKTCNSIASLTLRWRASFVPWQLIFTPFMSCVMLSFTCVVDVCPPYKPGVLMTPPSFISGMPSLNQFSFTGGLLELESQWIVANMPAFRLFGSMRIFSVSGRTREKVREWDKRLKLSNFKVYFQHTIDSKFSDERRD